MIESALRSSCESFGDDCRVDSQSIEPNSFRSFEIRLGNAVDKGSVPQFQGQQPPEVRRVVPPSTTMLVEDFLHDLLIEVTALLCSAIGQCIVKQFAKLVVEPTPDRHTESLLLAIDDFIGY